MITGQVGDRLLTVKEAAHRLGVGRATLYDWLGQSDHGRLVIRGQPVTIDYLQGGPRGQGRIRIAATEVDRLQESMRVRPQAAPTRRPPLRQDALPGITVRLGRPDHA
jgi:transposase-like protein